MAHINLLPWREEAKRRQQQQFLTLLVAAVVLAFLVVYLVGVFYDLRVEGQLKRNGYLQSEIAVLDQQIQEIRDLNKKKADLQKRMNLVVTLQQSRNVGTQILDAIARVVPPGVYLTRLERKGNMLLIVGKSESNNRLANMMRKIEQEKLFGQPVIESIVAGKDTPALLSDFTMRVPIQGLTEQRDNAKGGKS